MDNGNGIQSDDHDTGTWLLALTESGKGYLGRVVFPPGLYTDCSVSELHNALVDVVRVKLCPVYDYREMVKEVPIVDPKTGKMMADPSHPGLPAVQPMRTPLVMPVGFTGEQAPVHVPGLCYGTVLRFLDEMDPRDKRTYVTFAKETRDMMKSMRMAASNLVVPTTEEIASAARGKA